MIAGETILLSEEDVQYDSFLIPIRGRSSSRTSFMRNPKPPNSKELNSNGNAGQAFLIGRQLQTLRNQKAAQNQLPFSLSQEAIRLPERTVDRKERDEKTSGIPFAAYVGIAVLIIGSAMYGIQHFKKKRVS